MHSPRPTTTLNTSPQTKLVTDSALAEFVRTMAYPSNTNNTGASNQRQSETQEDAGSLKPRSRESLYPDIQSFDISTRNQRLSGGWAGASSLDRKPPAFPKSRGNLKKPPPSSSDTALPIKARSLSPVPLRRDTSTTLSSSFSNLSPRRRTSGTSLQTLPSDCSAEDLQAIQAALWEDKAEDEDGEEASMALVQQLIREELGLPPSRISDSSSHQEEAAAPQEAAVSPENTPQARTTAETQDLIYQLCLQLDEVNIDVKSENWQMLAPHVIDQLPLFCYDCTTPASQNNNNDEDNQCLVCLTDYQEGEQLRRLPKCGHCFHQACVDPWLLKHDLCPICRTTIDED